MRGFLAFVMLLLGASSGFAQSLLTVQGGYGAGNYFPGDTRFIAARTPGVGEVFKRWRTTGANNVAIDPGAWLQALSMPAEALTLRAEFQFLAPHQVQSLNINGTQARYAAPIGAAHSLLLRFHGTGGSAQNLFNPGEKRVFRRVGIVAWLCRSKPG